MSTPPALREHVLYLLRGGGAHLNFDAAIADLPAELRTGTPDGSPHSPWRLLEHLRICQADILEYTRTPGHVSPEFPDGLWPVSNAAPTEEAWNASVDAFRADLQSMCDLVGDPQVDLLTPIPHGQDGHTVLREALLLADHNAYHLGQLMVVRQALGAA